MTIRCAIYIRTNVGADHAELYDSQRQAVISFIAEREMHGLKCVKTYQDIGHSAGHLNRPALPQLLMDVASGHIDCVVIASLDRLSQSMADLQQLASVFQQHRVMLATVSGDPLTCRVADSSTSTLDP